MTTPESAGSRTSTSALIGGSVAGLLGTLAAVFALGVCHGVSKHAGDWLKGPHGPPFFDSAMATAVFYAVVGFGIGSGGAKWRGKGAGAAFAAAFLAMALPMAVLTRAFAWGEGSDFPDYRWINAVLYTFAAACIAGAAAAGAASGRRPPVSGALRALGAASVAYGVECAVGWVHRPGLPDILRDFLWGGLLGLSLDIEIRAPRSPVKV